MSRRSLALAAASTWLAVAGVLSAQPQTEQFVSPIGGVQGRDWAIVEYFDLDSGAGISDYRGGLFTSDGKQGLDFLIRNFVAQDEGVPVFAVLPGTVIDAVDGNPDRITDPDDAVDDGNYVVIQHENNLTTGYYHLREGSVTVEPGDLVLAGERIGFVGSSGASYWPHLYFEVTENGVPIETLLQGGRFWTNPPEYTGDALALLDFGVTDFSPTDADYVEGIEDVATIYLGDGDGRELPTVTFWTMVTGLAAGQDIQFEIFRPNGERFTLEALNSRRLNWGFLDFNAALPRTTPVGRYRIEFRINDQVIAEDSFRVASGEDPDDPDDPDDPGDPDDPDPPHNPNPDPHHPQPVDPRVIDARPLGPTTSYLTSAAWKQTTDWYGKKQGNAYAAAAYVWAYYAVYLDAYAQSIRYDDNFRQRLGPYLIYRSYQTMYSYYAQSYAWESYARTGDYDAYEAAAYSYYAYVYGTYDSHRGKRRRR
jgi:murein DD-endopeptidase MepM/ murein hydrolase activator NlpD